MAELMSPEESMKLMTRYNNILDNMPGGINRKRYESPKSVQHLIDTLHNDILPESYREMYSPKLLGLTPRQFFAEIDEVMLELGMDSNLYIQKQAEIDIFERVGKFRESTDIRDSLFATIEPYYQAMKQRGFWPQDITTKV